MSVERLHIIHTNDLHSHFSQWPHTVKTIKRLKKSCELKQEPYLLLDLGDHLDRSHYLTEGTLGKINVALLNQLGYNYVTIGNNEGITFSKEELTQLYTDASFKVLINNLLEPSGDVPGWLHPYTIHEVTDWRIGIIGTTINFQMFYELLGWKTVDPVNLIEEQINLLQPQVDLIILMSHLGLYRDERLAEQLSGLDIIIGAHTHHVLTHGKLVNQTFINQAGRAGEYVGHIVIECSQLEQLQRPYQITSQCIPTAGELADQETLQLLADWEMIARQSLLAPITTLDTDLQIDWHNESVLGNVLAESLRRWCDTEIAFVNAGQILDHLEEGLVTKEDLLHICPHPINPCIILITGEEIWSILQRSLAQDIQELRIRGLGFRGEVMGVMAVDGLEIAYTTNKNGLHTITNIQMNGHSIHKERSYKAATIDMFTFGQIYPELQQREQTTYLLPEFLRDLLAARLREGDFESAKKERWLHEKENGGA